MYNYSGKGHGEIACMLGIIIGLILATNYVQAQENVSTGVRFQEVALTHLGHVAPNAKDVMVNDTGTLAVWIVKRGGKQFILLNGKEGPLFDWVSRPVFSPSGEYFTYNGNRGGKRNTNRWEYPPIVGGKWFSIKDTIKGPTFDNLKEIIEARVKGRPAEIRCLHDPEKSTSADGNRVAYVSRSNGKWFMVVDGKEHQAYDWVAWPVFSPNGKRLAYVASRANWAQGENRMVVVVDGKKSTVYHEVLGGSCSGTSLRFSLDSKHVAYQARRIDQQGDRQFSVINGKESKASSSYYRLPWPIFSTDSKWVAYGIWRNDEYYLVVSNNLLGIETESKSYKRLWLPKRQDLNSIHFFGLSNGTIYHVKAQIFDYQQ